MIKVTHFKNLKHPHLRLVDRTFSMERVCEALMAIKTARFTYKGQGPLTFEEATKRYAKDLVIFGEAQDPQLITEEPK